MHLSFKYFCELIEKFSSFTFYILYIGKGSLLRISNPNGPHGGFPASSLGFLPVAVVSYSSLLLSRLLF